MPALVESESLSVTGEIDSMHIGAHELRIAEDAEFNFDEAQLSDAHVEP